MPEIVKRKKGKGIFPARVLWKSTDPEGRTVYAIGEVSFEGYAWEPSEFKHYSQKAAWDESDRLIQWAYDHQNARF
jgi:hypothetical protein